MPSEVNPFLFTHILSFTIGKDPGIIEYTMIFPSYILNTMLLATSTATTVNSNTRWPIYCEKYFLYIRRN